MRTIVTSPNLKNLTALAVEGWFQPGTFDALFEGCLPRLESLDLGVDEGSVVTTAHVEALAKARWASRLGFRFRNGGL
jgi:hypothetical protein